MTSIIFHNLPSDIENIILEMKTTLEVSDNLKKCFTSIYSKAILEKYNQIKIEFESIQNDGIYFDIFLKNQYLDDILEDFNTMKNCNCCAFHRHNKPQDIFTQEEKFSPHILFKKFLKRETRCMCFCRVLSCKFLTIFHSTIESYEKDFRLILDSRSSQLSEKIEKNKVIKWEKISKKRNLEYLLNSFGNYETNDLEEELSEKVHQLYLDIDRITRNINTNISLKNDIIREIVSHINRFVHIQTPIDYKYA
jgi:hypothetical protein